jgi:hypothetical protein
LLRSERHATTTSSPRVMQSQINDRVKKKIIAANQRIDGEKILATTRMSSPRREIRRSVSHGQPGSVEELGQGREGGQQKNRSGFRSNIMMENIIGGMVDSYFIEYKTLEG